jgi:hypothetical protein
MPVPIKVAGICEEVFPRKKYGLMEQAKLPE